MTKHKTSAADLPDPVSVPTPLRAFDARALLGEADTVGLTLDDTLYILRLTRAGKLILTK